MPRHVHAEMVQAQADRAPKLRVIHRSGLVTHVGQQAAGIRQFVGVRMDKDKKSPHHGKFLTTDVVEEVQHDPENHYARAVVEGHLAAADEKTARFVASLLGGKWSDYMATEEEIKLSDEALAALADQDRKNESEAAARRVVVAPASPDPKAVPIKLVGKSPAPLTAPPAGPGLVTLPEAGSTPSATPPSPPAK